MATVWIEAGSAATRDSKQASVVNTSGTGAISSDTQAIDTSVRSNKYANGITAGATAYHDYRTFTGTNTFGFTRKFRWDNFPADGTELFRFSSAGSPSIEIFADGAGGFKVLDSAFALLATGTHTTALNTDGRLCVRVSITNATTFLIKVYIGGVLDMNISSGGTVVTLIDQISEGLLGGSAASDTMFTAHGYAIDAYDAGADMGDVRVVAKLPNANGTTNGFTTQIGAGGSGYGTGHAPQVNERALSATNGWSLNTASAITEEYNVEGATVGDADLTGATILDWQGWVWAKTTGGSRAGNIVVKGTNSARTFTTTAAWYEAFAAVATYPAGSGTDVGMISQAVSDTYSLYECGVQIAYIAGAAGGVFNPFFYREHIARMAA